jgi:molecular chaperone HtpG
VPSDKRILEINPSHQVFNAMNELMAKGGNEATLKEYVNLLYNQALLLEGSKVKDPAAFARSIAKLMVENVKH